MPIYEYRCTDCEQIFEEWQKDFEDRETPCPVCAAPAKRIISNTAFILKGSGWYVTDYARGNNGGNGGNGSAKDSSKTDSGETKTEAKSEAKADSGAKSEAGASSGSKGQSKATD